MNEKETNHLAHPMDRTTNWCSHGGWFTLAQYRGVRTTPPICDVWHSFVWWLWINSWLALPFAHIGGGAYFDQVGVASRCFHCWICGCCPAYKSQVVQVVH
jgi:hypothetical protein